MDTPELLLDRIRSFNRKERHHLIANAVGGPLTLTAPFAEQVHRAVSASDWHRRNSGPIPSAEHLLSSAYVCMDYHLDWLAAAIALPGFDPRSCNSELPKGLSNQSPNGSAPIIRGNQEDADLLIATVWNDQLWLILIEAKFDSGWSWSQLRSKLARLNQLFPTPKATVACPALLLADQRPSPDGRKFVRWAINSTRPSEEELPYWCAITPAADELCMPGITIHAEDRMQPLLRPSRHAGSGAGAMKWKLVRPQARNN